MKSSNSFEWKGQEMAAPTLVSSLRPPFWRAHEWDMRVALLSGCCFSLSALLVLSDRPTLSHALTVRLAHSGTQKPANGIVGLRRRRPHGREKEALFQH